MLSKGRAASAEALSGGNAPVRTVLIGLARHRGRCPLVKLLPLQGASYGRPSIPGVTLALPWPYMPQPIPS